jgi:hypothetical protein
MLKEIGSVDRIPEYIKRAKDESDPFRLMGFGYRVYKNYDPRANTMRKVHLRPHKGPRSEFFYFTDNGDLTAVRYNDWKLSFKTIKGNLFTGTEESTNVPLVTNLRQDPWER